MVLCFCLLMQSLFIFVHYEKNKNATTQEQVIEVKKCSCGPVEHVFYKLCVKRYNKLFPMACLLENNDLEGLSENIVKAIEMFVESMTFLDNNNNQICPELNAKGNLYLPLIKNSDYVLSKKILSQVDLAIDLSAEELCQRWLAQLHDMKFEK